MDELNIEDVNAIGGDMLGDMLGEAVPAGDDALPVGVVPRHMYDQLQTEYTNLRETFNNVCSKYDINQCCGCGKYRRRLVTCPCGKTFCFKCKPVNRTETVTLIYCDKCKQMTCSNCSIDICSICNGHVCRRPDCIAYICDGSITGSCHNIICCDCQCKQCTLSFCGECMPGHKPCAPKLCSCGQLVYKKLDLTGELNYPIIVCKVCGTTSCECCHERGARHRAMHSIIPFIIANNRGELPLELPPEIIVLVWEHLQ